MKKAYHHGNLREELIQTGIKMIQAVGIEKLSLRKLAAACGVSEAAPYSHFANKEELLSAMQTYVTELLMNCLKETVENSEGQNSPESILNMGKAYVLFFKKNPEYYNFLFLQQEIKINLTLKEDEEAFLPFEYYKKQVIEVYNRLGLSRERIQHGMIAMWAKVHGLAAIISMKGVTKDFEWESELHKIMPE